MATRTRLPAVTVAVFVAARTTGAVLGAWLAMLIVRALGLAWSFWFLLLISVVANGLFAVASWSRWRRQAVDRG